MSAPRRPPRRLRLFLKGNLDLRDSLHVLRLGGTVAWNGLNEVLRGRGALARIRHETNPRLDLLAEADGRVPAALAARPLPFVAYPPEAQFSAAFFEAEADAYLLSIQQELATWAMRHREEGWGFYAERMEAWSAADRDWARATLRREPPPAPEGVAAALEAVIARLRARTAAPVLVFNLSAYVPGETAHSLAGLGETVATRIRRLNLALAEVSMRTGVSVIDVDRVLAGAGAARLKFDALHMTAEGCRLVAEEVARVLEDLGCLDAPTEHAA